MCARKHMQQYPGLGVGQRREGGQAVTITLKLTGFPSCLDGWFNIRKALLVSERACCSPLGSLGWFSPVFFHCLSQISSSLVFPHMEGGWHLNLIAMKSCPSTTSCDLGRELQGSD